jgi:hypothetical protein
MSVCGQPVRVPGVFSTTETDIGRLCQREAGHAGPHRWQERWAALSPAQVEAELERDRLTWDADDDDRDADLED